MRHASPCGTAAAAPPQSVQPVPERLWTGQWQPDAGAARPAAQRYPADSRQWWHPGGGRAGRTDAAAQGRRRQRQHRRHAGTGLHQRILRFDPWNRLPDGSTGVADGRPGDPADVGAAVAAEFLSARGAGVAQLWRFHRIQLRHGDLQSRPRWRRYRAAAGGQRSHPAGSPDQSSPAVPVGGIAVDPRQRRGQPAQRRLQAVRCAHHPARQRPQRGDPDGASRDGASGTGRDPRVRPPVDARSPERQAGTGVRHRGRTGQAAGRRAGCGGVWRLAVQWWRRRRWLDPGVAAECREHGPGVRRREGGARACGRVGAQHRSAEPDRRQRWPVLLHGQEHPGRGNRQDDHRRAQQFPGPRSLAGHDRWQPGRHDRRRPDRRSRHAHSGGQRSVGRRPEQGQPDPGRAAQRADLPGLGDGLGTPVAADPADGQGAAAGDDRSHGGGGDPHQRPGIRRRVVGQQFGPRQVQRHDQFRRTGQCHRRSGAELPAGHRRTDPRLAQGVGQPGSDQRAVDAAPDGQER